MRKPEKRQLAVACVIATLVDIKARRRELGVTRGTEVVINDANGYAAEYILDGCSVLLHARTRRPVLLVNVRPTKLRRVNATLKRHLRRISPQ